MSTKIESTNSVLIPSGLATLRYIPILLSRKLRCLAKVGRLLNSPEDLGIKVKVHAD